MADYDLVEAFKRIENELISSMIRNLAHHRAEETEQGMNWTQWQVEQLNALEKYRKNNQNKFGKQFESINGRITQLIRDNYSDGQTKQERKILQAIKRGYKLNGTNKPAYTGKVQTTGEFFGVNDRKLEALITATTHDMERAETAVLRLANDKYRKAIYNAQVYANAGGTTYKKAVDMAVKDMLNAGLNCVEYKNGARHTLSSYANMALRTATTRAYLQGEGVKRKEWGISTVILNKRSCPCPKCLPFVGKVFVDDVWSGGTAEDAKEKGYPLLSTAIQLGLYHPNCKDTHTTYFEGISKPPEKPTAEEKQKAIDEYNQEQKAHYNAQQAEKCERISKYSLDEENKRIYKARAEQWREKADSFYIYKNSDIEKAQYYKPVIEAEDSEKITRKDKEIIVYKTSAVNDIYVSENVKVKRKEFHEFDMNISEVYKLLGETDTANKPKICIISPTEMSTNAIASYEPTENRLNINAVLFYTDDLYELQKDFACPESEISTILHELLHWQDAEKYRNKFGEITNYSEYVEYLNKKFAPKLAKLQKNGYNILGISKYALKCYKQKSLDEVYTEYRVKQLLKG